MRDEWDRGFTDAFALRASREVRERLLRFDAPMWSAERLRGFLDGHEHMARLRACSCLRCPLHANVTTPIAAGSN